jgi:hypothetical protein
MPTPRWPSVRPEGAVGAAAVGFGALDFGFLTTAGPAIGASLRLEGDAYPWLFSAGSFAFAAVLPPAGGLLGRVTAARVLRLGAAVAVLGYALLIAAPGAGAGIAARVVTGAGGAAMLPAALALLGAAGSSGGFARSGGAVAGGFATGALLGGAAADVIGWRVAAAAVAALPLLLAVRQDEQGNLPRPARGQERQALLSAAMVACAAALWRDSLVLGIGAAVMAGYAIAAGVRRGSLPGARRTVQVCVLGFATTASGVGATALLGAVLARTGEAVMLGAFGLAVPVAVGLAARVSERSAAIGCATAGLVVQGGALLGLAAAVAGSAATAPEPVEVAVALLVFGLGHVLANAGAAELAVHGAGAASGPVASLLGSCQYAGGAIGSLVVFSAAGPEIADPAAGLAAACLLAAGAPAPPSSPPGEPARELSPVALDRADGELGVPARDALEDPAVLGDRGGLPVRRAPEPQRGQHAVERLADTRADAVPSEERERVMEVALGHHEAVVQRRGAPAGARRTLQGLDAVGQQAQIAVRGVLARERRRVGLEHGAGADRLRGQSGHAVRLEHGEQHVGLPEPPAVVRPHERAAARHQLHHPAIGERLQRLADRAATRAELLGQRRLGREARTLGADVADELADQLADDLLVPARHQSMSASSARGGTSRPRATRMSVENCGSRTARSSREISPGWVPARSARRSCVSPASRRRRRMLAASWWRGSTAGHARHAGPTSPEPMSQVRDASRHCGRRRPPTAPPHL